MTTQHTPGPWRAVPTTRAGNGLAWRDIVSDGTAFAPFYVAGALDCDAALIAAAPDLLAALQNILLCDEAQDLESMANALQDARAAIAKATGETA